MKISDEELRIAFGDPSELYAAFEEEYGAALDLGIRAGAPPRETGETARRAGIAAVLPIIWRRAQEAAAPLIAAQVLRGAVDEVRAILADDDAGPPEDQLYRVALWAAGKPGRSLTEDAP